MLGNEAGPVKKNSVLFRESRDRFDLYGEPWLLKPQSFTATGRAPEPQMRPLIRQARPSQSQPRQPHEINNIPPINTEKLGGACYSPNGRRVTAWRPKASQKRSRNRSKPLTAGGTQTQHAAPPSQADRTRKTRTFADIRGQARANPDKSGRTRPSPPARTSSRRQVYGAVTRFREQRRAPGNLGSASGWPRGR